MANKTSKKPAKVAKKTAAKRAAAKPALRAGGNPQIAKADGDVPVLASRLIDQRIRDLERGEGGCAARPWPACGR